LIVKYHTAVELKTTNLPKGLTGGLAIQSVDESPNSYSAGNYLVMSERVGAGRHTIYGVFGRDGMDQGSRFALIAFIVQEQDFPPLGVPISAAEWQAYKRKFTVESSLVTVIRQDRDYPFRITSIGGNAVRHPNQAMRVQQREDIS